MTLCVVAALVGSGDNVCAGREEQHRAYGEEGAPGPCGHHPRSDDDSRCVDPAAASPALAGPCTGAHLHRCPPAEAPVSRHLWRETVRASGTVAAVTQRPLDPEQTADAASLGKRTRRRM